MTFFIDTSALFAASLLGDDRHDVARLTFALLIDHKIHTTSYVLTETIALLQARSGFAAANEFDRDFRPLLATTWIDQGWHERAVARWRLRGTRRLSLVDCASFVVMEALGIRHAFAYDDDFRAEGFELVQEPTDLPSQ